MVRRWAFRGLLLCLCLGGMLTVSGCDIGDFLAKLFRFNGGNAHAQQGSCSDENDPCVETLKIVPETFFLTSDTDVQFDSQETATTYTNVDGTVSFQLAGGTQASRNLDINDTVIERPSAGFITIIRRRAAGTLQ